MNAYSRGVAAGKLLRITVLLFLVACVLPLEADYFQERPMDPIPVEYLAWYQETESCVDSLELPNKRDYHHAEWFVADSIVTHDGLHYGGATILPGNHITMLTGEMQNRYKVRHEMSHHITQLGEIIHTDGGLGTVCDGWKEYVQSVHPKEAP